MGEKSPWSRLNKTPTLSSARREIFHYDPQAPNDSLDFVIKAEYNHHEEFLRSSAETAVQRETIGNPDGFVKFSIVISIEMTVFFTFSGVFLKIERLLWKNQHLHLIIR